MNKLLLGAFFSAVLGQGALASCALDVVDLRWDGGSARFNVEVADDEEERGRGLMFREHLGSYSGMLFVYEQPSTASFWMKNTLIPLDMVFLDQNGVVQHVHENAVPGDLTSIFGGDEILAVLEVNGGLTRKLGITVGAEMRHSAFAAGTPVWPCD